MYSGVPNTCMSLNWVQSLSIAPSYRFVVTTTGDSIMCVWSTTACQHKADSCKSTTTMILHQECYSTQSFNSSMPDSGVWDPGIKPHCQQQTVYHENHCDIQSWTSCRHPYCMQCLPRSLSLHRMIKWVVFCAAAATVTATATTTTTTTTTTIILWVEIFRGSLIIIVAVVLLLLLLLLHYFIIIGTI